MLTADKKIWVGQNNPRLSGIEEKENVYLLPKMANRHGLIAGATGTGKTTTMKIMAESFSDLGVPVFLADIKGDLSGTAFLGEENVNVTERVNAFGITDFSYKAYPCKFWDVYGEFGHPVRVTISSLGPTLLSRLLDLSDVQEGVLNIVFRVADENGLELLDLKDLRSMLSYVGENAKEFTLTYGNVTSASIGAIQRSLMSFENEGGEALFGQPELDIKDWIRTDTDGRGVINILESSRLAQNPMTYSTFLLWMLTELYEQLPEVGDLEKPRFVFFFDEAHMLFTDAPKVLIQKIEQIIKLIRSKGVGVYFISQSPSDIPDAVLAQLNNKILHGLRAYTPAEQKKVKAAAESFRVNPAFDTETKIMELGTGEALISVLDEKGIPTMAAAASILPPQSKMGAGNAETIQSMIASDEFDLKYRQVVDAESAYEILEKARAQKFINEADEAEAAESENKENAETKDLTTATKEETAAAKKSSTKKSTAQSTAQKTLSRAASSAVTSVTRSVSTNIVNSLTGGTKKSAGAIAKQAATTALSSVMRNGTNAIIRGFFGNSK